MILSKWAGDSEKAVSQVFDLARTMQPSILFLDEVDSLGQSRDGNTDAGARRLLTELLIQFNRVAEEDGVYIFAATNRMQDCDPALLRRFSRRIGVPLPNEQERHCFFQSVLSRPEVAAELSQQDMQQLAQQTSGYSGSDLAAVCRLAVMAPVRELFREQRHQRKLCAHKRRRSEGSKHMQQQPAVPSTEASMDSAGPDSPTAAAGAGQGGSNVAAADEKLQLRKLVLADFGQQ
ncbi:P-loop containing nucleoside triphosphate hydrolase protein [Scenedesmus sp. NREL 46B-D3]|nr:P-loop containing nucleoside triphosphate hydrolase protein [Scenedesmus sp. NREL 46B-D3]